MAISITKSMVCSGWVYAKVERSNTWPENVGYLRRDNSVQQLLIPPPGESNPPAPSLGVCTIRWVDRAELPISPEAAGRVRPNGAQERPLRRKRERLRKIPCREPTVFNYQGARKADAIDWFSGVSKLLGTRRDLTHRGLSE
jgi:hypothetical protein